MDGYTTREGTRVSVGQTEDNGRYDVHVDDIRKKETPWEKKGGSSQNVSLRKFSKINWSWSVKD